MKNKNLILNILLILSLVLLTIKGHFYTLILSLVLIYLVKYKKINSDKRVMGSSYLIIILLSLVGLIKYTFLFSILYGMELTLIIFIILDKFNKKYRIPKEYILILCLVVMMGINGFKSIISYGLDNILNTNIIKQDIVKSLNIKNSKKIKDINETLIISSKGDVLYDTKGGYIDTGLSNVIKNYLFNILGSIIIMVIVCYTKEDKNKYNKENREAVDNVIKEWNELTKR